MEGKQRRPAKLLVVDDEPAVRELLDEGLQMLGYEVRAASGAAEALELVSAGGFDLVLSDIDMPGQNGLWLLDRVKGLDGQTDVVMVTGVVDASVAIGAIRRGASDYVTKPFNLEEVGIVIERVLDKRRLLRENEAYQHHLEDLVAERTRELEASYESTLQALVTALDFRDNETQGHSSRVVEYAVLVAQRLRIDASGMRWIRWGALLHDVGKIGISDAILRKPDKLDEQEWVEMRKHPEMGYRMLQHIPFLRPALEIVLSHQERFDGTGYPQGLRGDEIPLGARIFAVVDTFDAMTSDRPYRAALSIEVARDEVRRYSGIQFDPRVADAFLSIDADSWREIREQVHREVVEIDARVRRALG